ncbi:MAG: hypothetical protein IPK26_12765 [Planctomycetes bacterium]|nr:hypothetical protein [Planctomycetota bacterium]
MNASSSRIGMVAVLFGVALIAVLVRLWIVMVEQHETWLLRSHQNRWAFRDVPSARGALRDRQGRVLAWDEPTVDLHCLYSRFRRRHPVGAAVHGATTWLAVCNGDDSVRFGYGEGALDPQAACTAFLDMPVGQLQRGRLPRAQRNELLTAAVTVLATGAEWPRARVASAVLAAARTTPRRSLRDVLPGVASDIYERAFAVVLTRLSALAAELPGSGPDGGLLARLDRFRRDALSGARVGGGSTTPTPGGGEADDDRSARGHLLEDLLRPLVREVPFDLAAVIGTVPGGEPGLQLQPGLRRVRSPLCEGSLALMLGGVKDLDVALPSAAWLQQRVDEALDAQALDDLVPAAAVPDGDHLEDLRQAARRRYGDTLRRQQRRGTAGIEGALDDTLSGQPGLRFIERDAHAQEQLLWSHLRVLPGEDVALTLDLDLQRLVDEVAAQHLERAQRRLQQKGGDPAKVDVGVALIDAWSGDVLALGGGPLQIDGVPRVPALAWRTSGDLGSVIKPFVLLEQLRAEALGGQHQPWGAFTACSGSLRFLGQTLRCSHAHWDEGKDPVVALAKSCNLFFFQAAIGLGEDALMGSLARFGLCPSTDPAFAAHWQARPRELATAPPRRSQRPVLPNRAIGYGVEAGPLHVARAYAGLLTGALPTLGLQRAAPRPRVELGLDPEHLAVVHEGLHACVQRGTADHLRGLQELGVAGKTGTAEIGANDENNAWFAGWLPDRAADGTQLCFCAVVYYVPDGDHGGDAAGGLIEDLLLRIRRDPERAARWLPGGGR